MLLYFVLSTARTIICTKKCEYDISYFLEQALLEISTHRMIGEQEKDAQFEITLNLVSQKISTMTISKSRLNTLPCLHRTPINLVVFQGS